MSKAYEDPTETNSDRESPDIITSMDQPPPPVAASTSGDGAVPSAPPVGTMERDEAGGGETKQPEDASPNAPAAATARAAPRGLQDKRLHLSQVEIDVPSCCLAFELCFCCFSNSCRQDTDDDSLEVHDDDAVGLSHVGAAAYEILRTRYNRHHHSLWNVTSGVVVGELHQTPRRNGWPMTSQQLSIKAEDPPNSMHDEWFPEKMFDLLAKTEYWADVMSLGPPDGKYLELFKEALLQIYTRSAVAASEGSEQKIIIRILFGNIVGMPVNCDAVIHELTKHLPADNNNIQLWVGAWRKGVSWNHAKLVAVDGKYLHTGGHNMWHAHYHRCNPVYDLSVELQGRVAHDGHLYANDQWAFIQRVQDTCYGCIVNNLPDGMPLMAKTRVTVSEYPVNEATVFPPRYTKSRVPKNTGDGRILEADVPMITMGRYGTLHWRDRPSDAAILAMLESAEHIVHMVLQDLGPVCIPGTKVTLPGCVWPKEYLSALGKVMWTKGVDVEIVLSNPGSIPGKLKATEACYGNGWSCVDVAAEIIKTIQEQFPNAADDDLRQKVANNLRVCFIKDCTGNKWADGTTMGLHSKHFIVDDTCCYIGSQNLYVCDLAEWGVVIDHKQQVGKFMEEYWKPLWKYSYTPEDCDVQAVMDGLDIDRDAEQSLFVSAAEKRRRRMQMAKLQTPTKDMGDHNNFGDAGGEDAAFYVLDEEEEEGNIHEETKNRGIEVVQERG